MKMRKSRRMVMGVTVGVAVLAVSVGSTAAFARGAGSRRARGGGGQQAQGPAELVCVPADSVASGPTPTPAPSAVPSPAPSSVSSALTALDTSSGGGVSSGIAIVVQPPEGGVAADSAVLLASLYYRVPPTGRSPLAGVADVSRIQPVDPAAALELKSTDASPFPFDLTISNERDGGGWREASLVTAALFTDGTLSSVAYKCRLRSR